VLCLAVPLSAGTVTVFDRSATDGQAGDGMWAYYQYASWSQTSSYSNVSISAPLSGVSGGDVLADEPYQGVNFWLMNLVGPGASAANEIASTTVYGVGSGYSAYGIFNGLDLGPGTYYLLMETNCYTAFDGYELTDRPLVRWGQAYGSNLSLTGDAGVTDLGDGYVWNPDNVNPVYGPASGFMSKSQDLLINVVGDTDATPEPAAFGLVGLALAGFFVWRKR
jgi:hypothetical protein